MSLEITDARVRLYDEADDKLKAFASITLNDCFIVSDLKVIDGNNGLFVAMPSRKRRDGQFRDIAHPLNAETRRVIEDRILALYKDELAKEGNISDVPATRRLDEEQTDEEQTDELTDDLTNDISE